MTGIVRIVFVCLFATVIGSTTLAETAQEPARRIRFFSTGLAYDKQSIGIASGDTLAQWNVESAAVEAAVTTPAFFLGHVRFEPALEIAGGLAETEFRVDARAVGTQTIYSGRGLLLGGGGEVTVTPCGDCPVSMTIDAGYRTILDPERYDGPHWQSDLERYSEYGAAVRFGYGFAGKRFSPRVGMRWTHTDAEAVMDLEGPRPVELDHDRVEPFGGFDFRLPHLLGSLDIGSDWIAVSIDYPLHDFLPFEQSCGTGLPPCGAGLFCRFPPNAPCGSATVTGTCEDRPPACEGPIVEVCGCDGKTYKNVRCAHSSGVSVASPGPCVDPCNAPTSEIANGGFENGTYAGWETDYGSFAGEGMADWFGTEIDWDEEEPAHPDPAVITAASPVMKQQDPNKPVAPYCGASMLRINDLEGGAHATRVFQQFTRPKGTGRCGVLKVHWGAILQDGGHDEDVQPFFEIEVLAGKKQLYHFRADATNAKEDGWTDVGKAGSGTAWYRHSLVAIPLHKTSEGDQLEVRMSVADCREGGHGGAAFIDCVEILDRCVNPCPFPGKQPFSGDLYVPNFFSPDGNFINDVWLISNAPSACTASATIFDRWGTVVATPVWHDPSGASHGRIPLWDGMRDDGTPASPSSNPYYYVLEVSNCFETKEAAGFVYVFIKPGVERGDLLHVAGATAEDQLWHTIRYDAQQAWQEFGDVEHVAGERGAFVDVDAAVVSGQLHTVGVTDDGMLWHAIRYGETTGWQSLSSVNVAAKDPGKKFLRVAAAEVGGELHVCAIGTDYRLWHTIRGADGWQFFGDVVEKTGPPGGGNGKFIDVGCAAVGGELHVLLVNSDGNLFHTIRHAAGWQFLGNVRDAAPPPALTEKIATVSAGELNGALHVCVTTDAFGIYHTIRQTSWQFLANVLTMTGQPANEKFIDVSCRESRGELHLVAVSQTGDLWHTIRRDPGWDKLGNIEDTYAGERGTFTAVGIDGVRIE